MEFILNNLIYVAMAVISGGMLLWQTFSGSGANQISPQEATLLINRADAIVIDVRATDERANGHIPNSRHIVLDQLEQRLTEIEKYKTRPLIISCQSGMRSRMACGKLKKHGFEKVFNLAGGIAAWREAGLPVTAK
ncbi:MAG: rhodanese-like domain-containing protein [Sterolibacterium sp.]|mgnify:CR=1 FL=1|nr:rhodanese-like domain-containing protein [Sterolibacterium sp.]